MRAYIVLMEVSCAGKPEQVDLVRVEGAFSHEAQAVAWCQGNLAEGGYWVSEPVRHETFTQVIGHITGANWSVKRFTITRHQVDKLIGVLA